MATITLRNQTVEVAEMEVNLEDLVSEASVRDLIEAMDDDEGIIRELDEDEIIKHMDWSRIDTEALGTALGKEQFGTMDELREFCGHIIRAMQKGIDEDVADAAAAGVVAQAQAETTAWEQAKRAATEHIE